MRDNPDVSLLRYLLGRLINISIKKANWTLYENILLQCVMSDPSCISYVLDELLAYKSFNYPLDLSHIKYVMNNLIEAHAPINHGSEVAWAIWSLIALGLKVAQNAAKKASRMNDSAVAVLLLDAQSKNLIQSHVDFTHYRNVMTRDDLYGEQWLLSYEANIKNWLPSLGTTDHVNSDNCFGYLKSSSVEFYDDKWLSRYKPKKTKVRIPPPPGGFGDGY